MAGVKYDHLGAIACAYLGEYELAEVLLFSVCVEAVMFEGPDADLSLHAQHNLDCLHKVKAGHNQWSTRQSEGTDPSNGESADQQRAIYGPTHYVSQI